MDKIKSLSRYQTFFFFNLIYAVLGLVFHIFIPCFADVKNLKKWLFLGHDSTDSLLNEQV